MLDLYKNIQMLINVSVLVISWPIHVLFREVPMELLSGLELPLVTVHKMRYYYLTIASHKQMALLSIVIMELLWEKVSAFKETTTLHSSMSPSLQILLERLSHVLMMPCLQTKPRTRFSFLQQF